jgi:hypothetical protein
MADYYCWPLWEEEDPYNIDPASLPMSQELRDRLMQWASTYDGILNQDDPASSGFASRELAEEFGYEGVRLLLRLKDELGSGYVFTLQL